MIEFQHVILKLFVDGELPVEPEKFIELFHRYVRDESLPTLLIDVADYRHVPHGPGVMLIGHEADYSMDHAEGQWGLRYNRKRGVEGRNADRLREAFTSLNACCQLIEKEFAGAGLRFSRNSFQFMINDRAIAPNTPETLAGIQPEIEAFLTSTVGPGTYTIEHHDDPRSRFSLTVTFDKPFDLEALCA